MKAKRQVQIFLLFFSYEEFIKYSLLITALKEGNLFPLTPKLAFLGNEMVKGLVACTWIRIAPR